MTLSKWGVIATGICLIGGAWSAYGESLRFKPVEIKDRTKVMEISGINRKALERAIRLHDVMVDVRNLEHVRDQVLVRVKQQILEEARLKALEKCSVEKLADQFEDPEEVWQKMKDEYDRREQALAVAVNASEPATDAEVEAYEADMADGKVSPAIAAELFAPWKIGNEILTDVYQNPDNWGNRKQEATSFPLWRDQKYQVDRQWDETYTEINRHFGAPEEGRPEIGDERYDYARADEIEKAHLKYLNDLAVKYPEKVASLPNRLEKAVLPPRPLPPKNEVVVYLRTEDGNGQVYPALPAPWQAYAEEGFKDIAPDGEMADDFGEGMVLKEEALDRQEPKNRLSAYAAQRDAIIGNGFMTEKVLTRAEAQMQFLRAKIAVFVPIEEDADLLDPEVYTDVLDRLQAKYQDVLKDAETELAQRRPEQEDTYRFADMNLDDIEDFAKLKEMNPDAFAEVQSYIPSSPYEQDRQLLKALASDPEGRVFLNEINAGDVDKMMKESEAMRALIKEQTNRDKDFALQASVEIDETCLNGGI